MQNIPLMLALALLIGVVCQLIARFLRIPGIVLFLLAGAAFGPDGFGLINADKLGARLPELVSMAVAVILFEGGMSLRIDAIKRNAIVIRRLVTSGAVLTAIGGTLTARYTMEWSWTLSILFGTLIIVTGPTVVKPLLQRIGVRRNIQTILQAESVLIDPIGALIAIVSLEIIITGTLMDAAYGIFNLASTLLFGAAFGALSGGLLVWVLRRPNIVPDEYANILTLSAALAIFQASNSIFHESGIMTVTIAGAVIGNAKLPTRHQMIEFKEQLTLLLIGLLFVILTASIRLQDIVALGWRSVATVMLVMFVVRPLVIFWSARATKLGFRERLFMSWLAPRGIVAAAVASLFADQLAAHGQSGGRELQALVFLVIASTVFLQGLTAGPIAGLLGVLRARNNGYVILGANSLARTLALKLAESDQDTLLIDRDAHKIRVAEGEGIRVFHGNIMEPSVLKRTQVDTRRGIIALLPNAGINLEALRVVFLISKSPRLYLAQKNRDISTETLRTIMANEIFGHPVDIVFWSQLIDRKQVEWISLTRNSNISGTQPKPYAAVSQLWVDRPLSLLPLTIIKNGHMEPFAAIDDLDVCSELTLLVHSAAKRDIVQSLSIDPAWTLPPNAIMSEDDELSNFT